MDSQIVIRQPKMLLRMRRLEISSFYNAMLNQDREVHSQGLHQHTQVYGQHHAGNHIDASICIRLASNNEYIVIMKEHSPVQVLWLIIESDIIPMRWLKLILVRSLMLYCITD